MYTLQKLEKESLLSLLILFACAVVRCRAEVDSAMVIGISMPIVLFVTLASTICLCFWICMCELSRQYKRVTRSQTPQQNPHSHQSRLSSLHVHTPSTTDVSPSSTDAHGNSSETTTHLSQSPRLLEITLHKGDAPPAYAEALTMKTVIIIDPSNIE